MYPVYVCNHCGSGYETGTEAVNCSLNCRDEVRWLEAHVNNASGEREAKAVNGNSGASSITVVQQESRGVEDDEIATS